MVMKMVTDEGRFPLVLTGKIEDRLFGNRSKNGYLDRYPIKKLPLFYELAVNGKHYRLIHAAPLELYPAHEQSYRNQFRERKKRYKS